LSKQILDTKNLSNSKSPKITQKSTKNQPKIKNTSNFNQISFYQFLQVQINILITQNSSLHHFNYHIKILPVKTLKTHGFQYLKLKTEIQFIFFQFIQLLNIKLQLNKSFTTQNQIQNNSLQLVTYNTSNLPKTWQFSKLTSKSLTLIIFTSFTSIQAFYIISKLIQIKFPEIIIFRKLTN